MSDRFAIPEVVPAIIHELMLITLITLIAIALRKRRRKAAPKANRVSPPVPMVAQPQARQTVKGCVPPTNAQVMGKDRMRSSSSTVQSEAFLFWTHPEAMTKSPETVVDLALWVHEGPGPLGRCVHVVIGQFLAEEQRKIFVMLLPPQARLLASVMGYSPLHPDRPPDVEVIDALDQGYTLDAEIFVDARGVWLTWHSGATPDIVVDRAAQEVGDLNCLDLHFRLVMLCELAEQSMDGELTDAQLREICWTAFELNAMPD